MNERKTFGLFIGAALLLESAGAAGFIKVTKTEEQGITSSQVEAAELPQIAETRKYTGNDELLRRTGLQIFP